VFITHHLTAELARIMNDFPYSAEIEEWHHAEKKDAPSGTAETLAREIITHHKTYSGYGLNARDSNTLSIQSHREGDIKGIHTVRFTSDLDQIELKHEAFSRDGFALGAVMAAEFLLEQAPGVYSMQNLIRL
jgi:4-hydroxy-tetrahydrodipicolinate reductase